MKHLQIPLGLVETRDQQVVRLANRVVEQLVGSDLPEHTPDEYGVLDHGIQTLVATGTEKECNQYVGLHSGSLSLSDDLIEMCWGLS